MKEQVGGRLIYLSKGFKTNKLIRVETENTFEWIAKFEPVIVNYFDIENEKATDIAKNNIYYFLSGEIQPDENGYYRRKDTHLLSKDMIVLDYDELYMNSYDFKLHIENKLGDYSYIIYETIRSRPEKVRYRLILEAERSYTEKENLSLLKQVAELVDLPFDHSSLTWSQLQGLPSAFNDKTESFVSYGKKYPVILDPEQVNSLIPVKKTNALSPRSTTILMKNYIDRERKNLHDYANSLSCIMVLAKSVQTGEITIDNARKYVKMIALGNSKWEKNNLKKLEVEIKNPDIRTTYSFEEKFSKSIKNKNKLTTIECTKILMEKYHFALVGNDEDSRLHVYVEDEGIYTANMNYIYRLIYPLEHEFTEREVKDVYFKIKMQCDIKEGITSPYLIPLGNGIYNAKTKQIEPFSPEKVFTTKISTNYVKNAPKPKWNFDAWLSEIACDNQEVIQLLWQIINESVNGNRTRGKYFLLVGSGANGKGTFQTLLQNLIGMKNISTLKMHEVGERFKPFQMVGKTLNIGDDISGNYIEDNSNLQSITTGDYITVEQKGKDSFTAQLKLTMIFSANEIPKIRNKSNGTYRRMIIIPFNADFTGKTEDPTIKEQKLNSNDVLEYVLYQSLQLDFDKFIIPSVVKEVLEEYKEFNNPIVEFYNNEFKNERIGQVDIVPTAYLFKEYTCFCHNNGYKQKSQRTFTIEFQKLLGKRYEKKLARAGKEFFDLVGHHKPNLKPAQCFIRHY